MRLGKTIYDGLLKNKENLETGTYVIKYGNAFNSLLNTANGETELDIAFQSAWNAFSFDHADMFYVDVSKVTLLKESTKVGGITNYNVSIGPRR